MSDSVRDPLARLIETELRQVHDTGLPSARGPLVTIARDYGCGGEEIGRRLAGALQVPWYDKDLIERVAKAAHADPAAMTALDETVKGPLEVWVRSLLAQQSYSPSEYLHHLVRVLMGIARHGGVIMGRAGHLILRRQHPFRVRLIGSVERCAARVAAEEGLADDAATAKVQQTNQERDRFLREDFHIRRDDPHHYDLVVNTDGFADAGAVADLLLAAYRARSAVHDRHAA